MFKSQREVEVFLNVSTVTFESLAADKCLRVAHIVLGTRHYVCVRLFLDGLAIPQHLSITHIDYGRVDHEELLDLLCAEVLP